MCRQAVVKCPKGFYVIGISYHIKNGLTEEKNGDIVQECVKHKTHITSKQSIHSHPAVIGLAGVHSSKSHSTCA